MSLKHRQLSRIKDTDQKVIVRLSDGTVIEGSIVDLDQHDVCIRNGEFERVLALSAIVDVQIRTVINPVHSQLEDAMKQKMRIDLQLRGGEIIKNVEVIDLETNDVLVKNHNQERVIAIDQIQRLSEASDHAPQVSEPVSQITIPKEDSVPSNVPTSSPGISHPTVRSTAALLEQELATLSWPINEFPELIRECPVPPRTNRELGKIWSRALNYEKDRSWRKAAEEFARFAVQKSDSYEACHNAAVCWLRLPDYGMASVYFDYGIEREATAKILTAGIIAANQAQYWHKSLAWMLKYLMVTKGTDTRAYLALDFGLKFGMYHLTIQHIGWAAEAQFPLDWRWTSSRLAYIALRYPNLPDALLTELEQILSSGEVNGNDVMRIAETIFTVAADAPTLEYRNAQELETMFFKQNPSLNLKRLDELRSEIDELRRAYKYREAKDLVGELLTIVPDDIDAQKILRDLEIRLAPPAPRYQKRSSNRSGSSGYSNSIYNSAKKAEQRGTLDKAIKLYQDCIRKKDNKWQSAVMDLAGICLRTDDVDQGIKYILEYIDNLDGIAANNMLGALYFKGGKYEDAISAYRKVVDQKTSERERVAPWMSIAMIRIRQDKVDEAERILRNVVRIQPNQPAAKGLLESIRSGAIQTQIGNVEIDKEGYLNLSRAVGVGAVGIGEFLETELDVTEIVGLNREIIVNQRFGIKDVNYLLGKAGDLGKGKPEQVAQYCVSAAKVLDILNERGDDRFPESLRRFCAAQADYYAIQNFDVARTYYVESFRLENTVTTQLRIKFVQLLMTFLCEPEEFLKSEPEYDAATLLERGLTHQEFLIRHGIAFSVLNVARKNPDILVKLQEYFRRSRIRNAMVRALAEIVDIDVTNSDNQTLEKLIVSGQQFIEKAERKLEERFKWFLDNSSTAQLIYDLYERFVDWKPNFVNAGVDFGGRDIDRIERMKDILRQYTRFMDEGVFEEKDNLRNAVNTQIERLQLDIQQFPTYYSRCYMLPILSRWQEILNLYFDEIASVSKPKLEVIEVARATQADDIVSVHLVISNEQGKSAASGIRFEILKSSSGEYEITLPSIEFGKTLRAGEQGTIVVQVRLIDQIPAFTLSYVLSYTDRQGELSTTEESSVAIRLSQDKFAPIFNPYARWASSNEVTDPNMFFGRDHLVGELINLYCIPGQRKMIVIHGQKRAGKSSILYHVKNRIDEQGPLDDVIVCAFKMSIGDVITSFTLPNFFFKLARELHRSAKDKLEMHGVQLDFIRPERDMFREDPFDQFIEYTEELIRSIQASIDLPINLLMIIDEFTYVYEEIQKGSLDNNFMKAWKALVERRIFSFLLSGIDEMPQFVNAYPNEFAVADMRRVSYLKDEASRDLIEKPVWDEQMDASRFQERAVQRIQELTGGSAYYIQIFNNQLVDYMNEEETGYITEADIDTVMRRLTYGRYALDLAANFDNLTRFKNSEKDTPEVVLEGKLLRLIAFLTKNDNFAHRDSILRRFRESDHSTIERLISRLIDREVLKARAGSQQYAFVVDVFKEWLNVNLPYEEGGTNA